MGMADPSSLRMQANESNSDEGSLSHGIQGEGSLSERIEPTIDASINAADVLCGRGKVSFNHGKDCRATVSCAFVSNLTLSLTIAAGNKRFRDAVSSSLPAFVKAENRYDKSLVVHAIVDDIRKAGGRFLKQKDGKWTEMGEQQAKEKVGHAVRDALTAYENRKSRKKRRQREEQKLPSPERPNLQDAFVSLSSSARRQLMFPQESLDTAMLPPVHAPQPPRVASMSSHVPPDFFRYASTQVQPNTAPSVPDLYLHHDVAAADDHHDQFMARIDSVLGPLPPDTEDPMERFFHYRRRHQR